MAAKPLRIDPSKGIEMNFISHSPHVVVYRLWKRKNGSTSWTVVADGTTNDDTPDFTKIGKLGLGTKLAYWLGIGGNANSHHRTVVTLGQGGKVVPGGALVEQGKCSSNGIAVVETEIVLK